LQVFDFVEAKFSILMVLGFFLTTCVSCGEMSIAALIAATPRWN
jgi:hypothetical protein